MGPVYALPDVPEVHNAAEGPTYAHRFLDATRRFTTRPALRWKEAGTWRDIPYAELERRVLAFAAALASRGITLGDRVAIWLENSWPWMVCDLAAQLVGAVTTTVYHTLIPAQAVAILRDAGAKVILSSQKRLAGAAEAGGLGEASTLALSVDSGAIGQSFTALLEEGQRAIEANPQLLARLRAPAVQPDDLSALVYTSGTTGEPKGVMLTHGNVVANIHGSITYFMPRGGQTTLLHLPLAHVMARNAAAPATLLSGGVLAIAEPEREKLPANFVEVSPTAFITVPHVLNKFMERAMEAISAKGPVTRGLAMRALGVCRTQRLAVIGEGGAPGKARLGLEGTLLDRIVLSKLRARLGGRLEYIVIGGANSNRRSVEFFWGIGIPIFEGYGATEVTNTAAINWAGDVKLGTVGRSSLGVELKLSPDGEILVRGLTVMKGYWRQPEATRETIDAEGWYHTGDIGTLDADGYLTIIDRKREILVLSTGKNVAPNAIENTLIQTPLVLNVCAIGQRRPYVAALVVPDLAAVGRRLGLSEVPAIGDPRVTNLMREELNGLMSGLSNFERVKRFTLITESFSPENGLLTPTLKLRRGQIVEHFAEEIEDLFADAPRRGIAL
jgi:long-chain acyl-CoA synthetase